ncbi:MAG: hypothetical protein ACTSSE_05255 [Candidatus Thorarchaeota archaeon]
MSKTKKKNKQKKVSTADWLQTSGTMQDAIILRKLVFDSSQRDIENQPHDTLLFEKTYQLGAVPKKPLSPEVFDNALGFSLEKVDLQIAMSKRKPHGDSLTLQIQSLLPDTVTVKERESLTYVLSRIVTQRIPRKTRWPIIAEGLDTLTAALLQLYMISKAINQKIPWITAIWKWKIRDAKIDALETIQESLSQNQRTEHIKGALKKADKKFNMDLSINLRFDNQNPMSKQITDWTARITAAEEREREQKEREKAERAAGGSIEQKQEKKEAEKEGEKTVKETLAELRRNVRDSIGEIKGYSSSKRTQADVQSVPGTNWNILALRADGPPSIEHNILLRLLRKEFNILRYDPIRNLCINLSHNETPGHPSVCDLMQVSNYTGRNAYYEMHRLESLINEHYILNLGKIGLRYRYIFADRQRSGVTSDGLIEKLDFMEDEVRGCTVHIEPNLSLGPDMRLFSGDFTEAVTEHEIVTLNLNHYDVNTGDWLFSQQGEIPETKQKDELLIQRSTIIEDKRPFSVTSSQAELLGLLWSLHGARKQRKWLLDAVNYQQQTGTRNLSALVKNKVVRLLYLPALEFCSLPDGLVAYANCSDRKSRDGLVNHIIESQPFSRIHIGDSNDVVAHIHTPFKKTTIPTILKDKMQEFSDDHIVARMQERKTYKIPIFHKLLLPKSGTWKDPWPKGT